MPASEGRPRGIRHSPARDAGAVRDHYDVSNDFYRRLLGPSLGYSWAYFASPDDTVEDAQARKLGIVCRKLRLEEDERLLGIGAAGARCISTLRDHGGIAQLFSEPAGDRSLIQRYVARPGGVAAVPLRRRERVGIVAGGNPRDDER